jgi:uncharacterized membrane protein (UPF0127 family)
LGRKQDVTLETYRLVNTASGKVVATRVVRARSMAARVKGLLGRRGMQPGEGLFLEPCNGIHTFFLRFPIDVIVLDSGLKVLRTYQALPPWRMVLPKRGGHSTLELTAGTLQPGMANPGDRLELVPILDR